MSWDCSNCGTEVESQFKTCWNCGTDIHGNVDEDFAIETDSDLLDESPEIPRIRCSQCDYRGKVLFSTRDKSWIEWLVAGTISTLVSQRSWIHFCHKICPKCGSGQNEHVAWSGEILPTDEKTWNEALEIENKNARKNRGLFYLILASIATASFCLWLATR